MTDITNYRGRKINRVIRRLNKAPYKKLPKSSRIREFESVKK